MHHFSLLDYTTYSIIFISISLGLLISGIILGLSYVLAVSSPDPEKNSAYECGFEPFEDARNRFDVRFYIVAILFIIFDLEVAFLFPWAAPITYTGLTGYTIALIFLVILTVGFIYEVVKGSLNAQ